MTRRIDPHRTWTCIVISSDNQAIKLTQIAAAAKVAFLGMAATRRPFPNPDARQQGA